MKDLVAAALAAAGERGQDVADVPLTAIAAAAGISRSTLLRRLGGSRAALDEAVRQAGHDPGGRPPVRERAIGAAAWLVAERGLGAVTLDAVADRAECSVPSLHTVFEGRDGLLAAVFEQYGPLPDLEVLAADPPERLEDTVRALYRTFVASFTCEPRIVPAVFGDLFSRPDGPAARVMTASLPRLLDCLGRLLLPHVEAGRLRPLPFPVLVQLLFGPVVSHLLLRPVLSPMLGAVLPAVEEATELFAESYLRAVALPGADCADRTPTRGEP
ncbi:TetR/AcrR family transcriptional regulator [Kitasatospora sp. NPDC093102]|uniref:TetR/AcrR family transcriptional regulator n=1 Tax=Kitasatospora sp. NPDC093102 TaxID=3155069 RepID=UPI003413C833